jgi:UDP-N-acetylmuramoyl-tripeptide--D-alanyl-D-alanine ligase
MNAFDASDLAEWGDGVWYQNNTPINVSGFSIDTRTLKKGDIFVALSTGQRDGHDFIETAFNNGAVAALVSRVMPECPLPQLHVSCTLAALQSIARCHRQRFKGTVIAITGSCGKTSTKEILVQLLAAKNVCASLGNLNNYIGVPLSILRIDPEMHEVAILEAGINQCGEMELLGGMIHPNHVCVTSIGPSHLEGLKSVDGVAKEKASLIHSMMPNGNVYCSEAVAALNAFEFCRSFTRTPTVKTLENYSALHFPAMSPGMKENASLALLIASDLGVKRAQLQAGLDNWKPYDMRGQWKVMGDAQVYLDCYNANPLSMVDSAQYFDEKTRESERVFVLGAMGELGSDAEQWHYWTALRLPITAMDQVILIGESILCRGYLRGISERGFEQPQVFETAMEAAPIVSDIVDSKKAVFVKGSRRYRLETLFNSRTIETLREGVTC